MVFMLELLIAQLDIFHLNLYTFLPPNNRINCTIDTSLVKTETTQTASSGQALRGLDVPTGADDVSAGPAIRSLDTTTLPPPAARSIRLRWMIPEIPDDLAAAVQQGLDDAMELDIRATMELETEQTEISVPGISHS